MIHLNDPSQLTSDHGWDTIKHNTFLETTIKKLKETGCRVSLFIDPVPEMINGAANVGADRVELYTGPYAFEYDQDKSKAIQPFIEAANYAKDCGLGLNAGHDLNLDNLAYLVKMIPFIDEVSIGHALISDSLYFGLENTIQLYQRALKKIE